ncbi:aldose 1-epimerase family protein yeaD [Vibrio ishigakensis]|uniref:Putative glucose-6-phosphate 1-epimerase n=1 Tax=Vibrio ishigakensis TaxID=1481914 RepID=A0A0B8NLG9_9VIBR|nr:D-hexose-6-phosphate mutarotase [Vibrio ishigakensis]GAM55560.1 aldose 1-epimerase family protein yeaD [Vibrio ishigakensis]
MESINIESEKTSAPSISVGEVGQLPAVFVEHPKFSAAISLFGAHLLYFKQVNCEPLIWLSELAKFDGSKPIRGGVPICFPWFGNKESMPAHGFARTRLWELHGYQLNGDEVEVKLACTHDETTLALWPHKFESAVTFTFGAELNISMETTNLDEAAWEYSGALHTYLNVNDVEQVVVSGVGGHYFDGTNGYELTQGDDPMSIGGETIRVSLDPQSQIVVEDAGNSRSIFVENQGHNAAVVWNPWRETSATMSDMADHEYASMLCVESTVYSTMPVSIAPGESHTLATKLWSKS